MVTREQVQWCYRVLLEREPESEEVVLSHLLNPDIESLILVFVNAPEFRDRFRAQSSQASDRVPLESPALSIDTQVTSEKMGSLLARIRRAWTEMGERDAHFSVLTSPDFRSDVLAESINFFHSTGHRDVRQAFGMLRRNGMGDTGDKVCVEYGCGVGRLTIPLAAAFRNVIGYDISAAHLAHAAARLRETGLGNVRLIECAGDMLQPLVACDLFYSLIVLQHNPPPVIRALIDNALQALNPGGYAYFQVPTYIAGYSFDLERYLADGQDPKMEMHCLPQSEIFSLVAQRNCEIMEVREDIWTGRLDIFVSNTFVIRRPLTKTDMDVH